ncbi:MAG: multicopper oxidase domain-containing protein, partial [Pseudomonadota bacterium]
IGDERDFDSLVAVNPGKWMLHCHMLEHAAAGMRNWFEVSES